MKDRMRSRVGGASSARPRASASAAPKVAPLNASGQTLDPVLKALLQADPQTPGVVTAGPALPLRGTQPAR
jgi:hypothetical protein